ncbi:HAMP domain-containing histidine kinase [Cohnella sp. LGH]|uniref:sensor histidine kinase n=1 Tax=Cohnella sp. LGH TaxID=1619153 RepID=UPI001ADA4C05|nr:HAMP domain-containing sensor histidine kinase [Cohnella sp. LGH]QTH45698.1 HAMP domain-containing histidine kinase [Cohnella sp. LGH]
MKTLYLRIVVTFVLISLVSSLFALWIAGFYYQSQLKDENERKVTRIGEEIRALYGQTSGLDFDVYLKHIANMGFQIYAVNERLEGAYYGRPFKHEKLEPEQIRNVLAGGTYDGIRKERGLLLGFFENSLRNSVGLPIQVGEQSYALFIRPDLEQQIGEIRLFMAVLMGVAFMSSVALIVIFSRSIVRPVKHLTRATHQIVGGHYDVALNVSRRDEIGNLARDFTAMAQSLKQLDEMRQEFVANVSHEIQSPLTSIQGFAQTILDREATPEEAERYLTIIVKESNRLSSLSKQLLTLAALDKEAGLIRKTSFRLDEQIRQALIVTEWQWSEKRLNVEPELAEIVVSADPQLLYQVWFNLIVNAIKFSRPGGTIRIETAVEREVAVTVTDTGIGIGEEELPHIFERFYKADKSRTPARSGSGLGLAIVRRIVELHGGSVSVSSNPGEGSAFTVRLPYR